MMVSPFHAYRKSACDNALIRTLKIVIFSFLPHIYLISLWLNESLSHFLWQMCSYDSHNYVRSNPAACNFIWLTRVSCIVLLLFIYGIILCLLHMMPYKEKEKIPARLKIMNGGRKILRLCFWGILLQFLFYLFQIPHYFLAFLNGNTVWHIALDGILTFFFFYLLILNGSIRILCTCRSLGVWKRVLFICWMGIPIMHLLPLKYLSKRAKIEYDAEYLRFENHKVRDGAMLCAARYPIVLLHGIGFRDLQYFNYWGRIPKELVRNGALIYYGHQEAWGTIEANAQAIKETIQKVMDENHCDKVNIIAHSKGGLDARYLISGLHMEDSVASLTTMSTPHRGSELLNILNKLPDGIYHLIASMFDHTYRKLGDKNPDCYHASKQLSCEYCKEFNEKYPDSPKVYYQSYASVLKHTFGDNLLSLPNLLMFFAGASRNDGLVTEESAKWGCFKKTFVSTGRRGISHGDMIDLKREDYKGFDVIEAYVEIVSQLKEMGY